MFDAFYLDAFVKYRSLILTDV